MQGNNISQLNVRRNPHYRFLLTGYPGGQQDHGSRRYTPYRTTNPNHLGNNAGTFSNSGGGVANTSNSSKSYVKPRELSQHDIREVNNLTGPRISNMVGTCNNTERASNTREIMPWDLYFNKFVSKLHAIGAATKTNPVSIQELMDKIIDKEYYGDNI